MESGAKMKVEVSSKGAYCDKYRAVKNEESESKAVAQAGRPKRKLASLTRAKDDSPPQVKSPAQADRPCKVELTSGSASNRRVRLKAYKPKRKRVHANSKTVTDNPNSTTTAERGSAKSKHSNIPNEQH